MSIEIRTLETGEKISEPGFYNIPLDVHHSQCCEGVSVTSGVLRNIEEKTPGEVWCFHDLNTDPEKFEPEDTGALRLGRAMAAYIEGGADEVEAHFYVLPDNRPNRPTRQQMIAIKEGRGSKAAITSLNFWKEADNDPRDQITESQFQLIQDMGKGLQRDPAAAAILGGIPEVTMAWQDPRTGIWCLSRPDQVAFDGFVGDYKKISPQGQRFDHALCYRAIEKHRYDMQIAFACEGFEILTGHPPNAAGLLFQSDRRPHFCIPIEIGAEEIAFGTFHNHKSLRRFKECLDAGYWPEPGEQPGYFHWSDEKRQQILDEMQQNGVAL